MAERFLHTFDEWMTRVNKRLTALERRKAPPGTGGGGGTVPDPLNIGEINVSGKATVPAPLDPTDATTKEYVDAAAAAATRYLVAGENTTVTGAGTAASPWQVDVAATTGPGEWVSIGYQTAWRAYQGVDLWQVRDTGDGMRESSQILITTTSTITITAGQTYILGYLPPGMAQPPTRRGPYIHVQIRGSVITTGLLFIGSGIDMIRLIPDATTQIASGSQYIAVNPMRWAI